MHFGLVDMVAQLPLHRGFGFGDDLRREGLGELILKADRGQAVAQNLPGIAECFHGVGC